MIRAALAATIAICVLLLPAVAGADPTDKFSATIAPAAVQPSAAAGSYTIFVTNQANSSPATQGTIDIPTGFVLDVTNAPSASIVSGPCSGHAWNVTSTLAQLALAAPDADSALCAHGGTLAVSFSVALAPLVDGPYTWTTSLSGSSGPSVIASPQPTLVIDGTAPETTITGTPPSPSAPSVSFAFSGSDGTGSGVGGYQCSLDGGAFSACSSPKSYSGLLDGGHHFEVRAVDRAGNADPEAAFFDWTVDAVAPETTIDAAPPSLTSSRSAQLEFHGTDDGGSGVAGYQCALDGGGYASCSDPISYSGLDDGSHSFGVRAIDNVGNVDASPATASWTVDATPPAPPLITKAPSDPSSDTTPTFEFTKSDPTAVFWCQVDRGAFTTCPGSFTAAPPLGDGAHIFGVKAIDPAQNESTVTTHAWTVDTVHPLVSVDEGPPLLTNQTQARFAFTASKLGSNYQCALGEAAFASCTSPKLYSGLGEGSHTFAVRALWLGLAGPPTKYTWTVDTVPPHTTIASGPPASSQSASATFTFASSEAASTFTCRLDGAGFAPCTSPKTYTGLGDGDHTFSVQAVDAAGNADATAATYAWRISGVGPPTQDLRPPANVRNVRRSVGYGRLALHWRNPSDSDFDHVAVFVATKRSTPPRTLVFSGRSQTYSNRRFKNGLYYRYLIVSYDHAENAAGGTPVTVPPNVLLKGAGDGRIVHAPPLLRWTAVRKATFYNVQVFHRGQKILSAWPAKARQKLGRRWAYGGRHFTLRAGTYAWYVWPAFGPRAKSRYGQLLGEGTFKVR